MGLKVIPRTESDAVMANSCVRFPLYYYFKTLQKRNRGVLDLIFFEIQNSTSYELFISSLFCQNILSRGDFEFFKEKDSNDEESYTFFFETLEKVYKNKGEEYIEDLRMFLYATYLDYHFKYKKASFPFMGVLRRNPEALEKELETNYPQVFFISNDILYIRKDNVENNFSKLMIDRTWCNTEILSSKEKMDDLISGLEAYTDDKFILEVLKQMRSVLEI